MKRGASLRRRSLRHCLSSSYHGLAAFGALAIRWPCLLHLLVVGCVFNHLLNRSPYMWKAFGDHVSPREIEMPRGERYSVHSHVPPGTVVQQEPAVRQHPTEKKIREQYAFQLHYRTMDPRRLWGPLHRISVLCSYYCTLPATPLPSVQYHTYAYSPSQALLSRGLSENRVRGGSAPSTYASGHLIAS